MICSGSTVSKWSRKLQTVLTWYKYHPVVTQDFSSIHRVTGIAATGKEVCLHKHKFISHSRLKVHIRNLNMKSRILVHPDHLLVGKNVGSQTGKVEGFGGAHC